jgi:uncharacterized membrane protein
MTDYAWEPGGPSIALKGCSQGVNMEARAKLMGHPVHQMLVVFPLGLLGTGVIFDVVHLVTGQATFAIVAYWMVLAGIVGGFIAAPFGLVDWLAVPANTRAKRVGAYHGLGNVVVLLLFLASLWLRDEPGLSPPAASLACSFLGLALALVTAWLGGELVDRLGVGVHDDANLDAPSSLR